VTTTEVFASEQAVKDKQADLRAAKEAIAGPVPLIEDAPDPVVKLSRGLFHKGIWEREVLCRELTGVDEEALAKVQGPYAYFNTVLALGVVSIGTFDLSTLTVPERQFYLNDLLIGEREQVFLKIVQVSFGNHRDIDFTCTACAVPQQIKLILDQDFKPAEVVDVDATSFTYITSKGDTLSYRAALGSDQEEVLDKKGLTSAQQNTLMLSRCVTKRNGELIPDQQGFARSLPMRDRQKILELLVERQPQIDLNITTTCASCGVQQTLGMGWGDFFRT
jgi:hypothetical protein